LFADQTGITFASDEIAALRGADALLIATEWQQFRDIPLTTIKQQLKHPAVFDGRNIYSLEDAQSAGIYYESIGRETVQP